MSDIARAIDLDSLPAASATREDELVALSRVLERNPHHQDARLAMYEALKRHLRDDPFLAYVDETDAVYRVRTASDCRLVVPKRRATPRPYPPPEPGPLQPARRWLLLALLGLVPSGLGAILLAPLALFSALRLPPSALDPQDRRRRRLFLAAALLIWIVGLLLGSIVLVHL